MRAQDEAKNVILPAFLLRKYLRFSRGMTLGARVAVFDTSGRVLLVHQTYQVGWILPGGGVDRGETIEQAAIRELREETSVIAEGPLVLHGLFSNHHSFPGDHLACFITREFTRGPWAPNREIEAVDFFRPEKLPAEMNHGSRRRIAEITMGKQPDANW